MRWGFGSGAMLPRNARAGRASASGRGSAGGGTLQHGAGQARRGSLPIAAVRSVPRSGPGRGWGVAAAEWGQFLVRVLGAEHSGAVRQGAEIDAAEQSGVADTGTDRGSAGLHAERE